MALKNGAPLLNAKEMSQIVKKKYKGLLMFFYVFLLLLGILVVSARLRWTNDPLTGRLACIAAGHDVQTRLYMAVSHHSLNHGQSTRIFQDA